MTNENLPPEETQETANPAVEQEIDNPQYDGSTPHHVSPQLIKTISGYEKGMKRLEARKDYLEKTYEALKREFLATENQARKEQINEKRKKLEKEAPNIDEAIEKLKERRPKIEKLQEQKLSNVPWKDNLYKNN